MALVAMLAIDGFLMYEAARVRGRGRTRFQSNMTRAGARRRTAIVAAEQNKTRIALELARRQAKIEKALHLSVALDSGKIYLEREGAVLREMPVAFGPEAKVGPDSIPVVIPRGEISVGRRFSEDRSRSTAGQ